MTCRKAQRARAHPNSPVQPRTDWSEVRDEARMQVLRVPVCDWGRLESLSEREVIRS